VTDVFVQANIGQSVSQQTPLICMTFIVDINSTTKYITSEILDILEI
jgi:hypothetical protein